MTEGNGEVRELPEGWEWTAFSNIITFLTDYQANGSFASLKENVRYYTSPNYAVLVRLKDLRNNLQKSEEFIYTDKHGFNFLKKSSLHGGEILVANVGAGVGTTVIMPSPKQPATLAPNMFLAVLFKEIEKKYFFYFCQSLYFRRQISLLAGGSGQPKINKQQYRSIAIQIAPLQEQKRIVEKIEELLSELDQGIENLKTAQKQLKVYRQAVLKWAFEGKLTEQWRQQAQQQGNLKTGEELLAQIKAERENRYQQQVAEWEAAVRTWEANGKLGKKPSKPSKPKGLPSPTPAEHAELPQLPNVWCWVFPEEIASTNNYSLGIGPFGSNLKVSDYTESGMPLIFVRHITSGNFALDAKFVNQEKFEELLPHSVRSLDLLVTKMGDPPGDCEIYPQGREEGIITSDCLKFRVWSQFVNRKFYKYCINSNLIKKQLGLITKGVAQKKISLERFKSLKFPLPITEEQEEIVQEIEARLSNCDALESTITENLQKAEALRQSILKQAFEGNLVPQDPNDEPAEKLLERIRTEKQSRGNTGKETKSKHRQLTLPEV